MKMLPEPAGHPPPDLASELITTGTGVKLLHVTLGGFDTHYTELTRHEDLMGYLDEAVGWFSCSVWNQLPAGDHTIALLEIRGLRTVAGGAPLVFHASRFRRLAPGDQSA